MDKPSTDAPLTLTELREMLKRHAENPQVKKVIEQALSRRLMDVIEVGN